MEPQNVGVIEGAGGRKRLPGLKIDTGKASNTTPRQYPRTARATVYRKKQHRLLSPGKSQPEHAQPRLQSYFRKQQESETEGEKTENVENALPGRAAVKKLGLVKLTGENKNALPFLFRPTNIHTPRDIPEYFSKVIPHHTVNQ